MWNVYYPFPWNYFLQMDAIHPSGPAQRLERIVSILEVDKVTLWKCKAAL
jgi:hypothetical protein